LWLLSTAAHCPPKRQTASATAADVEAMPLAVAQQIYDRHYWDPQRCDDLPAGLDYSMFDYGVNSGIGRRAVWAVIQSSTCRACILM
jgi:lysozyme family protein